MGTKKQERYLYPLSTGLQQDALHFPLHKTPPAGRGQCPVATPDAWKAFVETHAAGLLEANSVTVRGSYIIIYDPL